MGYEFVACDASDTGLDLNCSAMAELEEVLDTLGVLDRQMQRPEMTPRLYISDAVPESEESKAYYLTRGVRSTNPGQVPWFKFAGNDDGWHVTADECAVLAEALRRSGRCSSPPATSWENGLQVVADFCARCATREGFLVF